MTIAFFTHYSKLYGANRSLINLIEGLTALGHHAIVFSSCNGPIVIYLKNIGIPCFVFEFPNFMDTATKSESETLQRIDTVFGGAELLANVCRDYKIDICYSNSSVFETGLIVSKLINKPHFWHFREFGELDYGIFPDIGYNVFNNLRQMSEGIIYISNSLKDYYDKPGSNSTVIYNGVVNQSQLKEFESINISQKVISKFIIVGLILPKKGQDIALKALRKVLTKYPETTLTIAGGGDLDWIKRTVIELDLISNVNILGQIQNPFNEFLKSDCGLMCSHNEALGRVTLEAMACGIPVIGNNSGATPEIIKDGFNGLLYNGTVDDLADKMIWLIENPKAISSFRLNCFKTIESQFTIETYANNVLDFISKSKDRIIKNDNKLLSNGELNSSELKYLEAYIKNLKKFGIELLLERNYNHTFTKGESMNFDQKLSALKQAEKLIQANKLMDAEIIVKSILEQEPENVFALNDLAIIEIMKSNTDVAVNILKKVLVLNPNNKTATENLKNLGITQNTTLPISITQKGVFKSTTIDSSYPKITVVTPSYNQGNYLEATIRSVLDQNYPNLEYIIMDGGSTDESVEIIKKYEHKIAYWQSQKDGGQYDAINEGFKISTGEIMYWLNSDDIMHDNALFKVADIFSSNNQIEWICGRANVCDTEGNIVFIQDLIPWNRYRLLDINNNFNDKFVGQESTFWKRTLWRKSGSSMDLSIDLAGDYELWVRFSRYAKPYIVDDIFASFRYVGDQRSELNKEKNLTEMVAIAKRDFNEFGHLPGFSWIDENIIKTPSNSNFKEKLSEAKNINPNYSYISNYRKKFSDDLNKASIMLSKIFYHFPDKFTEHKSEPKLLQGKSLFELDDQLKEITEYINNNRFNIKLFSTDFFDTIVYRLTEQPTDLFFEMGKENLRQGNIQKNITLEEFVVLRQMAEARARNESSRTRQTIECNLREIYNELGNILISTDKGIEIEIETEKKFIFLNKSFVSLLKYVHQLRIPIIISSDTYLSRADIISILEFHGFDISIISDFIISSEIKYSKGNGLMFKAILESTHFNPTEIVHIGDNKLSDYLIPSKLKIKSFYYSKESEKTEYIYQRERVLTSKKQYYSNQSVRNISQRFTQNKEDYESNYYKLGSYLFGPILTGFIDWTLEQFIKEDIHKVWGVLREGEMLGVMLHKAALARGYKLEVVPVYASRYSVNLASLGEATTERIYSRSLKRGNAKIRDIVSTFGLNPNEINYSQTVLDEAIQPETVKQLAIDISKSPYKQGIELQSKKRRDFFMNYITPFIRGEEKVGMLDLGYHGTIQKYISEIFELENVNTKITGCYLSTRSTAAIHILDNIDIRGYLGHLGIDGQFTNAFTEHPEILEQTLMAHIGSTEGYKPDKNGIYQPVLGPLHLSMDESWKITQIQEGIFGYQEIWLDIISEKRKYLNEVQINDILKSIDSQNYIILNRLFAFPSLWEAEYFGNINHDDNNGIDTWLKICDDNSRKILREEGLPKFMDIKPKPYWPQGIITLELNQLVDNVFNTLSLMRGF